MSKSRSHRRVGLDRLGLYSNLLKAFAHRFQGRGRPDRTGASKTSRLARAMNLESLEPRHLMATGYSASVSRVALLNDTGSSGSDKLTANLAITGSVSGRFASHKVRLEFDHNGDGKAEGVKWIDVTGTLFTYDPRHFDQSLVQYAGPLSISYRPVVVSALGADVWTGKWSKFQFTAELPPPIDATLQTFALAKDTGASSTDKITSDPTVQASISIGNSSTNNSSRDEFQLLFEDSISFATQFAIEWDADGDGHANHRSWLSNDGNATFAPSQLDYGSHTIRARVLQWDFDYGAPRYGGWEALSFTYIAAPGPRIESLSLLNDDGNSRTDLITSDPSIQGQLGADNDDAALAPVFLDWDGDQHSDAVTWSDEQGRFTYELRDIPAGATQIAARGARWDQRADADVFGDWHVFEFTFVPPKAAEVAPLSLPVASAALPRDIGLTLLRDTGDHPDDRITGDPTILGHVLGPIANEFIWAEIDTSGDLAADMRMPIAVDGSFRYRPDMQAGSITVSARAMSWDYTRGEAVAGLWQPLSYEFIHEITSNSTADDSEARPNSSNLAVSGTPVRETGPQILEIGLRNDTGQSATDRSTSDASLRGIAEHDLQIEVDVGADGTIDGIIESDKEGALSYVPENLAEGLVTIAMRSAADSRWVAGPWKTLHFIFSSAPDSAESQLLAAQLEDYEQIREQALSEYTSAVEEATGARDARMQAAAQLHTGRRQETAEITSEAIVDANSQFDLDATTIEQQHEAALKAAADRFQQRIADAGADSPLAKQLILIWPQSPLASRAVIPSENLYAPPPQLIAADELVFDPRQDIVFREAWLQTETAYRHATTVSQQIIDWQLTETQDQLRDDDNAVQFQFRRRVQAAELRYQNALAQDHPQIDLKQARFIHQQVIQAAENDYRAALQKNQSDEQAKIQATRVAWESAIAAANAAYDLAIRQSTQFISTTDPIEQARQAAERKFTAYLNREKAFAAADRKLSENTAKATSDRQKKDATALAARSRAIENADYDLAKTELEWNNWDRSRQIAAWTVMVNEVANAQQDADQHTAGIDYQVAVDSAAGSEQQAIEDSAAQVAREVSLGKALRVAFSAHSDALPKFDELTYQENLTANQATFQEAIATEQQHRDRAFADLVKQLALDRATSQLLFEQLVAAARHKAAGDQVTAEAQRWQDIVAAAYSEGQGTLLAKHDYQLERIDARRQYEIDLAQSDLRHASQAAVVVEKYRLARADIEVRYQRGGQTVPREVAEAAASKQSKQAMARVDHAYDRARIDAADRRSDRDLQAKLMFDKSIHGTYEQRSQQISNADSHYGEAIERINQAFQLSASKAGNQRMATNVRSGAAFDADVGKLDSTLHQAVARLDGNRLMANELALSARDIGRAEMWSHSVQTWASSPTVPSAWKDLHIAYAMANLDSVRSQRAHEEQFMEAAVSANLKHVEQGGDRMVMTLSSQASALGTLADDIADARDTLAASIEQAFVAAAAAAMSATATFEIGYAQEDRKYLDEYAGASHLHDLGVRDAFFNFRRTEEDAQLALALETITPGQYAQKIVAAQQKQRTAEAGAHVADVQRVSIASQQWQQQVGGLSIARAQGLATAASDRVVSQGAAQVANQGAELLAVRLSLDAADHWDAWAQRDEAVSGGQWNQAIAVAAADRNLAWNSRLEAFQLARKTAQQSFYLDALSTHAATAQIALHNAKQAAAAGSDDAAKAIPLLEFQSASAALDIVHAKQLDQAVNDHRQDKARENQSLVAAWNQADLDSIARLVSTGQEFVDRISSASVAHSAQWRDASATHLQEISRATQLSESQNAIARTQFEVRSATTESDFDSIVADALAQRSITVAQAQAALHIAGEHVPDETRSPETLTSAQRKYRASIDAANTSYDQAIHSGLVKRATAEGDSLVDLQSALAFAAVARTATGSQSSSHFVSVDNVAMVTYEVAASEAVRRRAEQSAHAEETRRLSYTTAQSAWINAIGQADIRRVQQTVSADVDYASAIAQAETNYHVASADATSALGLLHYDWLVGLAPSYVDYRKALASAQADQRVQLAQHSAALSDRYAANEVVFTATAGAKRESFVAQAVAALNSTNMTMLDANNIFLAQSTFADGQRDLQIVNAAATQDAAQVQALRDYLIGFAQAHPSAPSPKLEAAFQQALALAVRDHRIDVSLADLRRATDVISAEETQTQNMVGAASSLVQTAAIQRELYSSDLADLVSRHNQTDARALAHYAVGAANVVRNQSYVAQTVAANWQQAQYHSTATTLDQFSSLEPSVYSNYQAQRAHAIDDWFADFSSEQLNWIADRYAREQQFTTSIAAGYIDYADSISVADRQHSGDLAKAEQQQTSALADAQELYGMRLVPKAKSLDLTMAVAEQQYQAAVATADYQFQLDGDSQAHDDALAAAASSRGSQIAQAAKVFSLEQGLASADLRQQQWQARSAYWLSADLADADWSNRLTLADADWNHIVDQQTANLEFNLGTLDSAFLSEKDQATSALFARLAQSNNSPWAVLESEQAFAHAARSQALVPLESRRLSAIQSARFGAASEYFQHTDEEMAESSIATAQFANAMQAAVSDAVQGQSRATALLAANSIVPPPELWSTAGIHASSGSSVFGGALNPRLAAAESILFEPVRTTSLELIPITHFGSSQENAGPAISTRPDGYFEYPRQPGAEMDGIRSRILNQQRPKALAGHNGTRHPLERLYDEIRFAATNPLDFTYSATLGGLGGLVTSAKVWFNGTLTTWKSLLTLGFYTDPVEAWKVTESDIANGYNSSFFLLRTSEELLIAALGARFSGAGATPLLKNIGRGLYYYDVAQNVVSAGRGSYGLVFGEGLTLGNGIDAVGGFLGLSSQSLGLVKRLIDGVPPKSGELLEGTISLAVKIESPIDTVGHAFVVLDMPDGQRIARGFYPGPNIKTADDTIEFFARPKGGMLGEVQDDLEVLSKPGLIVQRFRLSAKNIERAAEFIENFEKRVLAGIERYHLNQQCAVFAKSVLRAAGLRPFIPIEYPPLMHAILMLRMFL